MLKSMGFKHHQTTFEQKLSAGIGLVLGLLFLAGGFWVRQIDLRERVTMQEAQGTVVGSVSRRERNEDQERDTYAPMIEFPANGDPTRFTGPYQSYRLSEGRKVNVRYDPKQPAKTARIVEPLEGLTPWAMFAMGGIAVVSSLGTLLPVRWSK